MRLIFKQILDYIEKYNIRGESPEMLDFQLRMLGRYCRSLDGQPEEFDAAIEIIRTQILCLEAGFSSDRSMTLEVKSAKNGSVWPELPICGFNPDTPADSVELIFNIIKNIDDYYVNFSGSHSDYARSLATFEGNNREFFVSTHSEKAAYSYIHNLGLVDSVYSRNDHVPFLSEAGYELLKILNLFDFARSDIYSGRHPLAPLFPPEDVPSYMADFGITDDAFHMINCTVYGMVGEVNDKTLRSFLEDHVKVILDLHCRTKFKVICDETNNTPSRIDQNKLAVDVVNVDGEEYHNRSVTFTIGPRKVEALEPKGEFSLPQVEFISESTLSKSVPPKSGPHQGYWYI